MPLFKRTQKRLARKAMEDETGLSKIKAALREENGGVASEGSSDEDDFESGSGSESEDEDEDEDEVGELSDEDSDSDDDEEIGENKFMANARREKRKREGLDSEEEDEGESDDEDELPLTVDEALEQPLYPVTASRIITDAQGGQHETKGTVSCVYCPNRILKNDNMVQLHLKSTGHTRAQKRFEVKISEMQKTELDLETVDPRDVVADIEDELAARTSKVESLPKRTRTAAEKEADEDKGDAEAEGDKTLSAKAQRRLEKKKLRNEARAARRQSAGEGGAKPQVPAAKENKDKPAQPKDENSTRKAKKAKRAEAAAPAASANETAAADAPSRKAKKANKAAK